MGSRTHLFGLRFLQEGQEERWIPVTTFPFVIGRGADATLRSQAAGIWDRHLTLELVPGEGLVLRCQEGAMATIEGQAVTRHRVRIGDEITMGAARVQFSLAPAPRRSIGVWEAAFWILLAGVALLQVALARWLFEH